jgi:hypothetical protein
MRSVVVMGGFAGDGGAPFSLQSRSMCDAQGDELFRSLLRLSNQRTVTRSGAQAPSAEQLEREEVDTPEKRCIRSKEFLPGRVFASFAHANPGCCPRFDPETPRSSQHTSVAPTSTLPGHWKDQLLHFRVLSWSARDKSATSMPITFRHQVRMAPGLATLAACGTAFHHPSPARRRLKERSYPEDAGLSEARNERHKHAPAEAVTGLVNQE